MDKYSRDTRREYNDGLIDATVNGALAWAYQDNNPNQQYMTMAIMEAMEQKPRQREALQQIRESTTETYQRYGMYWSNQGSCQYIKQNQYRPISHSRLHRLLHTSHLGLTS